MKHYSIYSNTYLVAPREVYSELSANNKNWQKVYADFAVFRRDSNQWFRFAEAGFDSFMQSQRL